MKKKETYKTFCPLFPGFYNTIFEYESEENDIDWYNEENGTNYDYDSFDWNYSDHRQRVSRAFVNKLESELKDIIDIKIDFEELVSPREYNFLNDSINVIVQVNLKELIKLIAEREEKANQYFTDKYTSCSGFIPFHSNYVGDWLNESYIMEKPSHRIGALLDCLCIIEIDKDDTMYWADDETGYIDFELKTTVKN